MRYYYYTDGKQRFGPFTKEELKEKRLKASTLVWTGGLSDWTRADKIEALKGVYVVEPPPLPGDERGNQEEVGSESDGDKDKKKEKKSDAEGEGLDYYKWVNPSLKLAAIISGILALITNEFACGNSNAFAASLGQFLGHMLISLSIPSLFGVIAVFFTGSPKSKSSAGEAVFWIAFVFIQMALIYSRSKF